MTRAAFAPPRSPTAAIWASLVATSALTGGAPEPSTSCAPLNKSVKSATEHLAELLRQRLDQAFFQAKGMQDEDAFLKAIFVDVYGWRAGSQAARNLECGNAQLRLVEQEFQGREAILVDATAMLCFHPAHAHQTVCDGVQIAGTADDVRAVVAGDKASQRHQERDDLFARHFEAATNAMPRKAAQLCAVDQIRWRIPD